jgi:ABC-2 type transport system permease protein
MRVLDFVLKEFRQLRRDRRMLPFLFVVPVFQLVLFGYAVSTDIKHLKVMVCDLDHTAESRDMILAMSHSEYFDYEGQIADYRDVQAVLDRGQAQIVLVIPRGFERDVKAGDTAQVQALLDGSDATTGTVAMGYVGKLLQARALRLLEERLNRAGLGRLAGAGAQAQIRLWYNPALETANFMIPGVMCVVVGLIATVLTAMTIVKEREVGTIEQLIVTPIRPWELMIGKMLPFLVVGYVNLTVILLVNAFVFHVPMRGSIALLAGLAGLFLIASLGVGLLISTVSQTQQQAQFAAVFFLMPNMLLSGFMFPIQNMPYALQLVTFLLPMRYFLVIARDIFMKGSGIGLLWDQVVPLALLTAGILLVAIARFQKRLD